MASADAQIRIVVNNMRALDKLSNNLNKLVKVNQVLVKSINKLETRLSKVTSKGFDDLGKGATTASQNISKTTASLTKFQKIQGNVIRTGLGVGGSIAGGVFGSGMVIQRSIDDINKLGNVFGITLIKAKGLEVAVSALKGALATGGGVGIGVALAGVIAALGKGAKDSYKLGQNLRDLTNKAGLTFKPINQDLDFTVKKFEKLNVQASNFVNLLRVMNPGSKGNVLRNTLRSQAGRAGTGFGNFSQGIGEYNPYQIASPTPRYGAGRIGPIHATQHSALQSNPYMGQFDNATQKSIARHTKRLAKISKHTDKIASLLANQQAMAGLSQYGAPVGPVPPTLGQRAGVMANNLGFGKNANPQGIFASRGGMGGRIRGAGSSAMIGGMFPLLFGQGGAASIGGGLGGLAGGALGGGLGFGLSLLGTVVGSKVQEAADFRKEIDKLNTSIKGTGGTSVFTVEKIKELAKNLGVTKEEALQAAGSFEQFGAAARATLLQAFPDEETFNYFSNIKNNQSLLEGMLDMQKKIGFEQSQIAIEVLKTQGFRAAELFLLDKTLQKQKQARIDAAKEKNSKIGGGELLGDLGSMLQQIDEANINKEFEDMKKEAEELINKTKEWNRELEKAMMVSQIKDELIKLQDPMFQIVEAANAIGDAFSSSFKEVIRGTMSVQQAFANMFNRIADHFADMAAQMAANQLQKGILSLFTNAFTSSIGSSLGNATLPTNVGGSLTTKQAFSGGAMIKYASGGYVTSPTVGLVGEAGENEYVIPASKMASSMQRYSAGARGEAVIPGTGSSYAGGGAGGSTTVNYSGPILNFNSEEFVPKSAVGQIIATAAKRGASMGETSTMKAMQNNRSVRSRMGM